MREGVQSISSDSGGGVGKAEVLVTADWGEANREIGKGSRVPPFVALGVNSGFDVRRPAGGDEVGLHNGAFSQEWSDQSTRVRRSYLTT